jgi:deoxyadenosine/deoxycytidine kinase
MFIHLMFAFIISTIVQFIIEFNIKFLGFITFFIAELYLELLKINVPVIISIDGNIGSGKSTLMKILKKNFSEYKFVDEPVDKWLNAVDDNNKNLLTNFYEDSDRWSYTFQNYAFITRTKGLIDAIDKVTPKTFNDYVLALWNRIIYGKKIVIFTERSILTDRNVFAEMLHESNQINTMEWTMYLDWYKLFEKTLKINHIVYLRTDPDMSFQRVNKRARDEEKTVSIEYLKSVHEKHESWLKKDNKAFILDGNKEFENEFSNQDKMIKMIKTKFSI